MNNTEDWIKILSGKEVPDANPETIREAQALRMELKFRKAQTMPTESIPPNPQILQNIFKETGLEPNRSKPTNFLYSILSWKITIPFPALATAILLVIVIPQIIPQTPIDSIEPIIGRSKSWPQFLTVNNPKTTVEELIIGLAELGLKVNVAENKGTWIINVEDLSTANPTDLEPLLQKYKLLLMPKHLEIHINNN